MVAGTAQHPPESIGGSCLRPMLLHLGLDHIHLAFEFILINSYQEWTRCLSPQGVSLNGYWKLIA